MNECEKGALLNGKLIRSMIKGKPVLSVVKNNLYNSQLCRNYMSTGKCKYGRVCQFAHGKRIVLNSCLLKGIGYLSLQ